MELWEVIVGSLILYTWATSRWQAHRINVENGKRLARERYYLTTYGLIKAQVGNYAMVALIAYVAYRYFGG